MASYWGEVDIIQNRQSIEGNYSSVTANYYACTDNGTAWSGYESYPYVRLYFGTSVEESQTLSGFNFRNNKRILIGSITRNVPHNPDGTMSVSASFTWQSGHSSIGTLTGSANKVLTTIPRASAISATDANIGSSSSIGINSAVDSFTHTVTYTFGNKSGTIKTKTSEKNFLWDIPTNFFEEIPNDDSGIVTLTCYTYNGNTHIGTTTKTMTVTVPQSGTYNSIPVITSATARDTNPTTIALTGNSSRLVLYKSTVEVSAVGQCKNYAGFKYFRENNIYDLETTTSVSGGTTTVNGTRIYSTSTTPTFDKTQFRLTLIDKRNFPSDTKILSQANGDFTIVPYVPLTINASVERVNSTSSSVYLSFSGNFYNGYYDASSSNFNTPTIKWRYKEAPSGSWSSWTTLTRNTHYKHGSGNTYYSGSGNSQAKITLSDVFNYQKSYILEVSCADRLSTVTVQKPITQGDPIHDEGVDANGNNYFNINANIYKNNKDITKQNMAQVYNSSQLNITVSTSWTTTKIPLSNSNIIGTVFSFDSTNKRLVVSENGYIDFIAKLNVYLNGYVNGDYSLQIYKNGVNLGSVDYKYLSSEVNYYDSVMGNRYGVQVSAGDYFEMYVMCGGTGTLRTFEGFMTSLTATFRRE